VVLDTAGNILFGDDAGDWRVRKVDTNGIITTVAIVPGLAGITTDCSGNLFVSDMSDNCVREYGTNGIITLVAGNGTGSCSGDGGPATDAGFNLDYGGGLALDGAGNLFIADTWNERVRKVDTNGIVTTVAGNGTMGYAGDGEAATNASFILPSALAADKNGNLFIADAYNNRIRRVDTNGVITTVAGNGPSFYGSYSGDGGPATNASLNTPLALALDGAGNLLIADSYNGRIRMVALAGLPALTLSNVSLTNAGQYQVIVTGAGGSVTSSVATLTVSWPTYFSKVARNGDGSVALNCLSAPNSTNLLLVSTNVSPQAPWQVLSTNIAASDGTWQYTDTNTGGVPARFYRFLTR
jgi:hypothetical protein